MMEWEDMVAPVKSGEGSKRTVSLISEFARKQGLEARNITVDGDTFFAAVVPDTGNDWVICEDDAGILEDAFINTPDDPVSISRDQLAALVLNLREPRC